jgi:hypothetical protein
MRDFVEQDDFGRRERPDIGDQLAGGRIDHLEPEHFGRLQSRLDPHTCRFDVHLHVRLD